MKPPLSDLNPKVDLRTSIHQWLRHYGRYLFIIVSLLIFLYIINLPTPSGLTPEGLKALGIFFLCVAFWITGVVPMVITSLMAIILFPLLGVLSADKTYALFGNKAVFFILGAFILASSLMRSGLSSRIALQVLKRWGQTPRSLLLSMLLLPAFLSFWMSANAVAAMMYPIVAEIAHSLKLSVTDNNYGTRLFLSMTWGCVIGGVATFLGGARAYLAVGIMYQLTGASIDFLTWSGYAIPTVIVSLIAAHFILDHFIPYRITDIKQAEEMLKEKNEQMGAISTKELFLGLLVLLTVFVWVFYGNRYGLANIALAAVIIAFIFKLMNWKEIEEDVNWGIFLMYGGAICLGFAMDRSGASAWLAQVVFGGWAWGALPLLATLSLLSLFLTEAISNTAVVALLMPVVLQLGAFLAIDPRIITMAVAIPSGLAFILPMGTPAVAISYSSGYIKPRDLFLSGITIKLAAWIIFLLTIWLTF
ncbi:MAG: SLC13 family permease [bacterium]